MPGSERSNHQTEAAGRRPSLVAGAAFGALWTTALVALCALGERLSITPNIAYDLFSALTRQLPGAVVTFGIDTLSSAIRLLDSSSTAATAKLAEKGMAVMLTIALGTGIGMAIAALSRPGKGALATGIVAGLMSALLMGWIESSLPMSPSLGAGIALAMLLLAWGSAIGASLMAASHRSASSGSLERSYREGRQRRLLLALTGMAGGTIALAYGAFRLLGPRRLIPPRRELAASPPRAPLHALTSGQAQSPPAAVLKGRVMPVLGTRSEITANADFYRIDINLDVPRLEADRWRLTVGGLVDNAAFLTLEELRRMPAVSQVITLECISNPVGGDLIGTSRWTGCRVRDLLRRVAPHDSARAIAIAAADGFYENLSMSDAMDERSLLVYEMNGAPLPFKHGYPLRLYAPNRHGMKLPKWIQRLDLVERPRPGFWVQRGWSQDAIPHTTSVIDTIRVENGRVSLGGIAYAGSRGISAVNLQIDRGPWQKTILRAPPLSPLTWIQWRFDGPIAAGRHEARVRAVDGTGAAQRVERQPPHPDGATGLHTRRFRA